MTEYKKWRPDIDKWVDVTIRDILRGDRFRTVHEDNRDSTEFYAMSNPKYIVPIGWTVEAEEK